MRRPRPTRRRLLAGLLAAAGTPALSTRVLAAAPPAEPITPALVAAAVKEGKVSLYTAMDVTYAELLGKAFEAKYPGIKVRIERSGSERIFQRIAQEYASHIFAVDVINTADAAHVIPWKREGWLAPYLPEEVARHYPAHLVDAEAMSVTHRMHLSIVAYNTSLVPPGQAPTSFADLLDPKWSGKIVKAHPGYSGVVVTATQQLSRELGWSWFEKLSKQKVMQVQSATEPPKKMVAGERAIMADGGEYLLVLMKEKGDPLEIVYPTEGTPLITGPSGIMGNAPNPNAARLFHAWSMTAEAQQLNIDVAGLRSAHPKTNDRPGVRKFSDIRLLREEPAVVADKADEIKAQYVKYFKV
jgi:iron(III) transport system substrate-binding protein